ncbi:23S rRNA (adenine(2503)-C(2))-methyltransferase RlmN [Miltoncostaea marina]|uniref:23S rRNA (adenine(2503)-C(2))-methyltransferase RlmN n=1 Tax=Miltoncostaea marina TaxID=2843215 RepID=UPI001C3D2D06|nr:23S rRNA (adenine(2503)-C(2))-methyltransferase RlmN [Miltoncostaea marina]
MDRAALASLLAEWGQPPYRARQAAEAQRAGADGWADVSAFPAALRARLEEHLPFWTLEPRQRVVSRDGTVKWGLRAGDGAFVEAVLIAHEEGRRTVCVSSQAGCALACRFCATGAMGPGRDLTPAEILDQAVLAAREAAAQDARLTNVVFMGMGEPMQNLDAVLEACGGIAAPEGLGISPRRIAISTVGWVPGIARLADHPLAVRLAISLHAADDDTRSALMPINARYPIANLLSACRRYCDTTGRRVFIEYLLLDGVNDAPADARRLARLLRDGRFHVNVIEYNPTAGPYRASPPERRRAFLGALADAGLEASVRRSRGADVAAACGQLARA